MIPMTPMNQMQGSGIFTPGPPMQNTLTEDDILKVALKVKSLMITDFNELINLKVEEATSYPRKDIDSLRSENAQLKDDLSKLENKCTTDIDALEQPRHCTIFYEVNHKSLLIVSPATCI